MRKAFHEWMEILGECYKRLKKNNPVKNVTEDQLSKNLDLIDEYIDCASSALCEFGLEKDFEPNEYGLMMEDLTDYLLKFRYKLVDK